MPISLICGACEATLTAPDAAAGKRVKCRKCGAILEIPLPEPESDADYEVVEEAPTMMLPSVQSALPRPAVKAPPPPVAKALPLPAKAKPKPVQLEIDDDDEDDRPSPKKKSKPALLDDDDEDRPSPKKPVKKLVAVEDDDEDDKPRPKKLKKGKGKKAAASNLPLLIGGGVLGLAVVGFLIYWFAIREPEVAKGPITNPPGGGSQGPTPGGPGGPRFPGGSGGPQGGPAGWSSVEKPTFTARVKGDANQAREQAIPKSEGVRSGTAYVFGRDDGAQIVTVIELDALGVAAAQQNPTQFLTNLFSATVTGKGTIQSQSAGTLDGKPARDAKMLVSGKVLLMRAAVVGSRVFILAVGGDGVNDASHEQVQQFFDNFKPAGK